jgi:hypothetical protein
MLYRRFTDYKKTIGKCVDTWNLLTYQSLTCPFQVETILIIVNTDSLIDLFGTCPRADALFTNTH